MSSRLKKSRVAMLEAGVGPKDTPSKAAQKPRAPGHTVGKPPTSFLILKWEKQGSQGKSDLAMVSASLGQRNGIQGP